MVLQKYIRLKKQQQTKLVANYKPADASVR